MKKSNFGLAAISLAAAFGLSACDIEVSADDSGDKITIKSYSDVFNLPTCDGKSNDGLEAYVTEKGTKYKFVCRDEWYRLVDGSNEEPIYPDDYRTTLSMGLLPNGLVILGTQVWDSKNLNVSKFDGKKIGHCYEDEEDNCDNFGRLYNWAEAMNLDEEYLHKKPSSSTVKKNHQGICPEGFHIPNGAEIDTLYKYVDKTRAAANYRKKMEFSSGDDVEGVMLRTPNTAKDGTILWADESGTVQGIDAFGMSFVSTGMADAYTDHNDDGDSIGIYYEYRDLGKQTAPWLSNIDDDADYALNFRMDYSDNYATRDSWSKTTLHPVRCIMNKTASEYKLTSEYKDMLKEALGDDDDDEVDVDITIKL